MHFVDYIHSLIHLVYDKMNDEKEILERKIEIQDMAERQHEYFNCQSTCCISVGLGKSSLAIRRIIKAFNKNENAKIIFSSARELHLDNFKRELIKFNHEDLIDRIIFCCHKSLTKYYDVEFDLYLCDESHMQISLYLPFLAQLYDLNPDVEILCLSGTPKKNHPQFFELEQYVPISYTKLIDDAIDKKILNNYNIHIIFVDMNEKEKRNYHYWFNRYKANNIGYSFELQKTKSILKHIEHKERFTKLLLDTQFKDKKVLIYAGTIDLAERLDRHTYHSKLSKKQRVENYENFYNDKIYHLVNVNGIKESVSIPNLKYGIITYIDASRQSTEQAIGRFCRLPVDEEAHIYILCVRDTIEEKWIQKALSYLDSNKIKYYNARDIEKKLR